MPECNKDDLLALRERRAAVPKIWAIHSGSDWADASAEYLVLPPGLDIEAEHKAWERWYRQEFAPACSLPPEKRLQYISLHDWLLKRGARKPTADELQIYDDR